MRKVQPDTVRELGAGRDTPEARPLKRLPRRRTTKQMHERLLRALGTDRRFKRSFS